MPKTASKIAKDVIYQVRKYALKTTSSNPTAVMNYYESITSIKGIEQKVESIAPDISSVKRMYVNAVLNLCHNPTSKDEWIKKWSINGLDKNILEKLWNYINGLNICSSEKIIHRIMKKYINEVHP